MKLEKVHLSEVAELEPLVKETLHDAEEGLQVLDNQIQIGDQGRPDIIATDFNQALTIIELKSITAEVGALSQIIRYYEWFVNNLPLFARPFPQISLQEQIRLIIIAPSFSDDIIRISKYLDTNIDLIKYTSVKNEKTGEIGILYENIEISPEQGPGVLFRSIEDIVKYFSSVDMNDEFTKVIEDLKESGIEVRPYKGGKHYWIECRHNEEDIGYFQPRQRYFNCQTYDEDKEDYIWPPIRLKSYEEWVQKCKPEFLAQIVE